MVFLHPSLSISVPFRRGLPFCGRRTRASWNWAAATRLSSSPSWRSGTEVSAFSWRSAVSSPSSPLHTGLSGIYKLLFLKIFFPSYFTCWGAGACWPFLFYLVFFIDNSSIPGFGTTYLWSYEALRTMSLAFSPSVNVPHPQGSSWTLPLHQT